MEVLWDKSPATGFEYRQEPVNGLPPVCLGDDIDLVILHTYKDRIRYKNEATGKLDKVPVLFYNENDRVKTEKLSPFIIIMPMEPMPKEDHVVSSQRKVFDPDADGGQGLYLLNQGPYWYNWHYNLTIGATNFHIYRRLVIFIRDFIHGLVEQQRRFLLSKDENGKENYRHLYIDGQVKSEDYENNYFQYDLQLHFDVALFVKEWVEAYNIKNVNLELSKITSINTI